jgi:hypothetical protein
VARTTGKPLLSRTIVAAVVGCGWITARWSGGCFSEDRPGYVADAVLEAAPLFRAPPRDSTQDNDEVEWQGGQVYLHLGVRRDDRDARQ